MLPTDSEHNFLSCHAQVFYCSICGCIKSKNSITIPLIEHETKSDPTKIFQNESKTNFYQRSLKMSKRYKILRKCGISFIKILTKKFSLGYKILHSTVYLVDRLFLQFLCTKEIKQCALICAKLLTKFYGEIGKSEEIEKEFSSNVTHDSYQKVEDDIISKIDHNLFFYSAYDIMMTLLNNGILFENEVADKIIIYSQCIKILNSILEQQVYLINSPVSLAFAIVSLIRQINGLENKESTFEAIYNISSKSYQDCLNTLRDVFLSKNNAIW